jgi:hypothetical protein
VNTPSPEVQRAARNLREALEQHQFAMHYLREALEQHQYAMRYGTPEDTVHTAEEVEAARARLRAVVEKEEEGHASG